MPPRHPGTSRSHFLTERINEVLGLLLVAFAVFLALALWTFHPNDPSWSDRVDAGWAVRNYGGAVGAYLAGALIQLLGTFAALVPLGLLVWGVAAFAGMRSWRLGWPALGGLLILLSAAGMLYKTFRFDPLFGETALAGGVVGYAVAVLLEGYLGRAGSWVVLTAVLLAALVATTGLSLGRCLAFLARAPGWAALRLAPFLRRAAWAVGGGSLSALRRLASAARPALSLRGRMRVWKALSPAASGDGAFGAEADPPEALSLEGAAEEEWEVREPGGWGAAPSLPGHEEESRRPGRGRNRRTLRSPHEEPASRPDFIGSGRSLSEAPALSLPGPAAEPGGEKAERDAVLFGPATEGEKLPAPRREEPSSARPAVPSSPGQGAEKPPAGAIRIGRRGPALEKETPSPRPVPAEPLPGGPASEPREAAAVERSASREDEPFPSSEIQSRLSGDGVEVKVRHAGAEGEAEIVRIEDDSIVPEEESAPAAPLRRKARAAGRYVLPSLDLFADPPAGGIIVDDEAIRATSRLLERTLREFGVEGYVSEVKTGPVVTIYEFAPAAGVKVSKIAGLSDDLARALSAVDVRVVAPIPGKSVVGIEVPNGRRNAVYLRDILSSREFAQAEEQLTLGLGKDILGRTALTDLAKIPHLLIAGTTGSGKSVLLNVMICSLLVRCMPREVRLLLIDPKMLEFSIYEGVPHLLVPVVTDPKKAAAALRGLVAEMERRYRRMSEVGVRNIERYNELVAEGLREREAARRLTQHLSGDGSGEGEAAFDFLPYIVVVIDELADLMMISSRDVEEIMTRLAQMARAAGIHLLAATQRPSVDVLTGLIKANFPSRIALRAASRTDSRTTLDMNGAERLLGKGDMLFVPPGTSTPVRIHGAYVSEKEIGRLVAHWREQGPAVYQEGIFVEKEESSGGEVPGEADDDERYHDAVALIARTREASISLIQRHLRIGYNRAARMIERMEQEGIIGPADGVRRRQVFISEVPGEGAEAS